MRGTSKVEKFPAASHETFTQLDHIEDVTLFGMPRYGMRKSGPHAEFIGVDGALLTGPGNRTFFSRLFTLKLEDITFKFVDTMRCGYCPRWTSADGCECRAPGLAKRRDLGCPIARLVFHLCVDWTGKQKAELQGLVAGEVIEVGN